MPRNQAQGHQEKPDDEDLQQVHVPSFLSAREFQIRPAAKATQPVADLIDEDEDEETPTAAVRKKPARKAR